jgi:glycerol uptake facilitator protein
MTHNPQLEPPEYSLTQRLAAEGLGTFFLVFVGAGTVAMTLMISREAPRFNSNNIGIGALGGAADWLAIALAFAFVIMAMVYIFGHVSGAHINPAVTLALLVRGEITLTDAVGYWAAQLVGGIAGAYAIGLVYGQQAWEVGGLGAAAPFPGVPLWRAGVAEAIGQFALVLGVFGLAVNRKAPSGWAGLIIALNIGGLVIFLGNVSGAAINPARTLGPVFADWTLGMSVRWEAVGVYLLAQAVGALAAAWVYPLIAERVVRRQRRAPDTQPASSAALAG